MAFFDDLGKKISQAGQTAVQKTKEMTDITRINGLISDEEKKVSINYYQIGKLYVAMHRNDFESDFNGMISAVCESEAKIRDYKQQIQDIKGVVHCEKCGAEIANGIAFCSSCGTPIQKQNKLHSNNPNLIRCTGCGVLIDKNMRFCTSCGKPIHDITKVNDLDSIQGKSIDNGRKCSKCGATVDQGLNFCTECGAKVD